LGLALMPLPAMLEQANIERIQVYERTARLTTGTTAFEGDTGRVRAALADHQAVTFNEVSSGLAPNRRLALEVGVAPEKFDDLVSQLRQIGHLDTVNVQQRDRTAEFRRLHTQRQALKKHQETIMKLRGVAQPSLEDTLKLEQKIQDLEKEL